MSDAPRSADDAMAFGRLHPKLQEPLYRMKWTQLHPIQVEAIREVMDGDGDLLIAAQTASGKTEAAFLPILSRIVEEDAPGVRAIYAGPLKALINDQFLRLERLCEFAEIPVHRWHGDVVQGAKQRLLQDPAGVLLITPESIESLFVNHPHQLPSLFANLRFIVIDEMHSFIGNERGAHLKSLLARLSAKSPQVVRMIGLSATLGDMDAARRWLRPREADRVHLIEDRAGGKSVKIRVCGYLQSANASGAAVAEEEEGEDASYVPLMEDVFRAFRDQTALIFANSKSLLERCADFARRESERLKVPDHFRIHHGSLSKGEREETEEALRSDRPTATFCSSTLEMGIDVGNVQAVGQIGAPWSVGSLVQRLGRSGRREGEARVLRMFIEEEQPEPDAPAWCRVFPELLQAVAMTELLLAKWCEPPDGDRLHLSTLVQQALSVIAEAGGAQADRLFDVLVTHGAFANVDQPTFVQTLRALGAADLIEQTPEGSLILGLKGERIVRSYGFYTAFQVHEDFRVAHDGRDVGRVTMTPAIAADGVLILAGRSWRVSQIDEPRKLIQVEPSPGGRVPKFRGSPGSDIHPKVRATMRELLERDDVPAYLDPGAAKMLAEARATAREAGLLGQSFLLDGPQVAWLTWTGSRVGRTLCALGKLAGLRVEDAGIALVFEKASEADVRSAYRRFLDDAPTAEALADRFPQRAQEKYDPYLGEELLAKVFARNSLDLDGALALIRRDISGD